MPDIPSIGDRSVGPVRRTDTATSYPGPEALRRSSNGHPPTRDRVELSDHARLLDRIQTLPQARESVVDRVRSGIADGTKKLGSIAYRTTLLPGSPKL